VEAHEPDEPAARGMTEASIDEELRASATRFAQSALRAFLGDEPTVFLLHAATALEQLAKGFLASIHGSLVAANDFDSLLHACGQSTHAHKPRSRMRTITAQEAVDRAGRLIPAIENLKRSLQLLILPHGSIARLVDHALAPRPLAPSESAPAVRILARPRVDTKPSGGRARSCSHGDIGAGCSARSRDAP
jgi:hypothetical protein